MTECYTGVEAIPNRAQVQQNTTSLVEVKILNRGPEKSRCETGKKDKELQAT